MSEPLHIAFIHVHVKPEHVEAFRVATIANASASRKEPGNLRFDFFQEADDPTRFVLVEVFRNAAGIAAHRETPHYLTWRQTVADMMAEPRAGKRYVNIFPDDAAW